MPGRWQQVSGPDVIHAGPEDGTTPVSVQVGPYLLAPVIYPDAPDGDPGGTRAQLTSVLDQMTDVMRRAGAGTRQIARVTFFLSGLDKRPALNEVWAARFPSGDDRPPHKYIPAELPPGIDVALQVLSLPGERRRELGVPGVVHGDPMTLGARTGPLLTTSRLFVTSEEEAGGGLDELFDRIRRMLDAGGTTIAAVRQLTFFTGDPAMRADIWRRCWDIWKDTPARPEISMSGVPLPGTGFPRVEVLALCPAEGNGHA